MNAHNITILGIDNGLDGGIVVMVNGQIAEAHRMPTIKQGKGRRVDARAVASIIRRHQPGIFVIIEEAGKHSPGVLALCSTWRSFGTIETICEMINAPYEIVRPQQWQAHFWSRPKIAKGDKFDTKAAALQAARRLWPEQSWLASDRCTNAHDGIVDAALLAEWGRRRIK